MLSLQPARQESPALSPGGLVDTTDEHHRLTDIAKDVMFGDALRRKHHNETIGVLCGTKKDRSAGAALDAPPRPWRVAAYTYDKLPPIRSIGTRNERHIVAAQRDARDDDGD